MVELNENERASLMRTLRVLAVFLIVFIGILSINAIKNFRFIGHTEKAVNTMTISGTGFVQAVADIATETVTINEEGKTQKEAQDKATAKEKKVLDFLRNSDIADKDIKTTNNSVSPKYDYVTESCRGSVCPPGKQVITGYIANETIEVKIRKTEDVGKIVQGLSGVGAELYGPNYTIDDEEALKSEARKNAIKDAKKKAKALEDDLGINLGRIVNFQENTGGNPIYYEKATMNADSVSSAPAPELPKGENKITSNVTLTYEIR